MIGIYACTDHDAVSKDVTIKDDRPITFRNPSTVGDRVYFTDYDEFADYYESLQLIMDTYDGDYFDSIVNLSTSVQTLNDLVYTTVGYIPTIHDYNLRAIINPYNEFQVDDVLVTLINDTEWLLSDASNGTLKTTLRGLTKGVPLDIGEIPAGAQWVNANDLEKGLLDFWCGCRARIERYDCETIRVYGSCSGYFGTVGGGEIDIEINEGPHITDEEVGNNFEFFIDIAQFHGEEGTIDVTVDPNCFGAPNDHEDYDFDPEKFEQCDPHERDSFYVFTSANGNERIRAHVYYSEKDVTQLGLVKTHNAEMWSESKISGTWTNSYADLTLGIDAIQRGATCSFIDSKDDQKHRNNRHHLTIRVNWLAARMYHCDGDLIGYFEKERNSVFLDESIVLDFHCCDE